MRECAPHLGQTFQLASRSFFQMIWRQPSHFCHRPSVRTLRSPLSGWGISSSGPAFSRLNQDMQRIHVSAGRDGPARSQRRGRSVRRAWRAPVRGETSCGKARAAGRRARARRAAGRRAPPTRKTRSRPSISAFCDQRGERRESIALAGGIEQDFAGGGVAAPRGRCGRAGFRASRKGSSARCARRNPRRSRWRGGLRGLPMK